MKRSIIVILGGLLVSGRAHAVVHSVTITERAGVTTNNYPIQLGRPFAQGEIAQYPQVLIDGTPVATQADVKMRWTDSSVKHAVLTFYIPTLTANSSVTVTFQNQATGNNAGFLNKAAILAFPDFGAMINASNGSATAATMVGTDHFSYWLQGSVATSIRVADHSTARIYDIGNDANRSIRPMFDMTFWPLINKIRVRFIGENSNTQVLQDEGYGFTLHAGAALPIVYGPINFTHHVGSRWTKEVWIGGTPSVITINHNLAYLAEHQFLPNYDVSKTIPNATIQDQYTRWQSASREVLQHGLWEKLMPNPGGRPDIGLFPDWTVQWLYSGDERSQEVALGQAQFVGGWPMHFREGDATKFFDAAHTTSGLGLPVSVHGRPTLFLNRDNQYLNNAAFTVPADQLGIIGARTTQGWLVDGAHQPDPSTPQYMLTGDYWYLEELQFWASWGAFDANPFNVYYGRGPNGSYGGISDEPRGDAWLFRTRMLAAYWSPDGSPEKSYFETLVNDAISIWEGTRHVTGTSREGNALWSWGNTVGVGRFNGLGAPPLHHWDIGNDRAAGEEPMNPHVVSLAISPWMQNFLINVLGFAKDLGYDTSALLSWLGENLINQVVNPVYGPYASAAFQMPVVAARDGKYIQSWAALRSGFLGSYNAVNDFQNQKSYSDNYIYIAMAASAMIADQPGGGQAWNWLSQECLNQSVLVANPKWAILPRSISSTTLAQGVTGHQSLAHLRVFPNPWRSDQHAGLAVSFDHLYPETEIKIFTLTGRWVKTLTAEVDSVSWDLTNREGHKVASGIYFYTAQSSDDTKTGKFAVIK